MARNEDYTACGDYERHFNTLQGGIRGLASAWILAACAGFSVLLLKDPDKIWLLHPPVLIAIMCFMATIGLALLWVLDQFIYQKLLGSVFLVGLRMEQLNPNLPPTRALMVHAFERRGASRLIEYFYVIPAALLALVTIGTRIIALGEKLTTNEEWSVIVLFLLEVLLIASMIRLARRVPAQAQAAAIGEEFHALFTNPNRLEQLIMRNSSRLRIAPSVSAGDPAQHLPLPHRRRATDDIMADLGVRLQQLIQLSGI